MPQRDPPHGTMNISGRTGTGRISNRARAAAGLAARGHSQNEIADRLGISRTRVRQFMAAEWWPALLAEERGQFLDSKPAAFTPLTPQALRRLEEELLGLHGNELAHRAAVFVLEQRYGRAAPTSSEGESPRTMEVDTTPADAFVELIRQADAANRRFTAEQQVLLSGRSDKANVREVSSP